jgi:hypothetical protein
VQPVRGRESVELLIVELVERCHGSLAFNCKPTEVLLESLGFEAESLAPTKRRGESSIVFELSDRHRVIRGQDVRTMRDRLPDCVDGLGGRQTLQHRGERLCRPSGIP